MNLVGAFRSRFARNAATLQVAGVLSAGSNLASSIALAHILGAVEQGRFVVGLSLYSLLFLVANMGISQATVSQVASAAARGLADKCAQWLAFQLKTYLILSALLMSVGWFLIPAIGNWIGADPELARFAWLLTLTPLLETPRVVSHIAFQGTRRMLPLARSESGQELVRLFLVVVGAILTRDFRGPIIGTLTASAFGSLIALDFYRRESREDGGYPLPSWRKIFGHVGDIPMRQGLRLGVRIGVMRQVDALSLQVLPSLILQWAMGAGGESYVAWFRIAQRIIALPMVLMQGVSRTALPALSELAGLRDMDRFRSTFRKVTLISGTLVASGLLLGLPFIRLVVGWFYPADYVEPVWTFVLIMSIGMILNSYAVAVDSFYIVTDQLRLGIAVSLAAAVTMIPATVLLASNYPPWGVGWAYSLTYSWVLVHYSFIFWYFRTHKRFAGGGARGESIGTAPRTP